MAKAPKKTGVKSLFKTSSYCECGEYCVGVRMAPNRIDVTNTKDKSRRNVTFTKEEWNAFLLGVKNGEFDL